MTTPGHPPLQNGLVILRRVRNTEITRDSQDRPKPISSVFRQGGLDGEVSVYLASETTAAFITREYPGTFVAELTIAEIRTQGLDVTRDPIPGDPGHCNITGRKTRAISRTLAALSRWSDGFSP